MTWGQASLLIWLWLAPAAAVLLPLLERRRQARLARLAETAMLPRLMPHFLPERRRIRHFLWWLALTLLLVALARPQWGTRWQEVRRRGLDIMVLLDTSNSMRAEDLKPNRLQRAKWGIRDMLQKLHGDRVGLIAFAGESFVQCPLTIDYAAFLLTLDDVHPGIIPRGGTATAQALKQAMKAFDPDGNADRVVILISDGEDHEGDPLGLLPHLQQERIKVFAIGVGSLDGELIPLRDPQGRQSFLKDAQGNVVKTALQEGVLQRLAIETGGAYVRATPADFGEDRIIEKGFATLKRSEKESTLVKESEDRFHLFVGLAFLLLLVEAILPERSRVPVEAAP